MDVYCWFKAKEVAKMADEAIDALLERAQKRLAEVDADLQSEIDIYNKLPWYKRVFALYPESYGKSAIRDNYNAAIDKMEDLLYIAENLDAEAMMFIGGKELQIMMNWCKQNTNVSDDES